jgi:hypothetical protein
VIPPPRRLGISICWRRNSSIGTEFVETLKQHSHQRPPFCVGAEVGPNYLLVATVGARRAVNRKAAAW